MRELYGRFAHLLVAPQRSLSTVTECCASKSTSDPRARWETARVAAEPLRMTDENSAILLHFRRGLCVGR